MEQSKFNFFKKMKAIALLFHGVFFLKKRRFLRKPSKPGHGKLALITSPIKFNPQRKLNFRTELLRT